MTKGRKTWFIGWASVIIITGVFGGISFAIFPLVIFGFIELIRLFVFSVKRSKVKLEEQKEHLKELREQRAIIAESEATTEMSSQSEPTIDVSPMKPKETPLMNLLITIIAIPLNLFIGWFLPALVNMDIPTWLSKKFGYRTKKCRYCGRHFNSVSYYCQHSPGKHHRE
jgi:hypothetical protein